MQLVPSPSAELGLKSSILAGSHTFINNIYSHSPPSVASRMVVVSYKQKYVHAVLINGFVKLTQEKVW